VATELLKPKALLEIVPVGGTSAARPWRGELELSAAAYFSQLLICTSSAQVLGCPAQDWSLRLSSPLHVRCGKEKKRGRASLSCPSEQASSRVCGNLVPFYLGCVLGEKDTL